MRIFAYAVLALSLAVLGGLYIYANRDQAPLVLAVGAGPHRSDSHELMREVADVIERQSANLRIKVVATKDSSQNISLLNEGKVDLATIRSDTPVISDVRLIANLFPDYFQLITRRDSGVVTVDDLRGRRIVIPPFGTDEFKAFWIIADHYDLQLSKLKWQARPFETAIDKLLKGEVDALFTVRSLRDRKLADLIEDAKLKHVALGFLEIDQASAIAIKRPFLRPGVVPKGAHGGSPPTPTRPTLSAVVDRVMVTRSGIDASAISELTRVLFEHRLDLTIRFALASAITQPDGSLGLSVPLHEGAESYYNRDKPAFIQENAEPIALLITVAAMLGSGLLALRGRFSAKQKNRLDSYNYQLLDIAVRARASEDRNELRDMKAELFTILETVVKALDTDAVTEEGFQSFSLLWESVRETINYRISELVELGNGGQKPA